MFDNNKAIKVSLKTIELLDILRKNLEKHVANYKEAMVAFKAKYLERLNVMILYGQSGKFELQVNIRVPETHAESYERFIKMLEMATEQTVELDEYNFDRFVNDNWERKHSFIQNTGSYLNHG